MKTIKRIFKAILRPIVFIVAFMLSILTGVFLCAASEERVKRSKLFLLIEKMFDYALAVNDKDDYYKFR